MALKSSELRGASKKIIRQSQNLFTIPSRQHVDEYVRAPRRKSQVKNVGLEVVTKCRLHIIRDWSSKGTATETSINQSCLISGNKKKMREFDDQNYLAFLCRNEHL